MFSEEILTKEIPFLNLNDSGSFALSLMEDMKIKHLPVVNEGVYVCLVSEKDVFQMANPNDSIKEISLFAPYVREGIFILEILRIMNKNQLDLIPVINAKEEYQGVVTQRLLLEKLDELCNKNPGGALIALEMNPQDYFLSQLIHLVEQNEARVLNLFSYLEEETAKQIVLLKIDLEDAGSVLRSLERFNYIVRYYSQKQILNDDTMQNRLNELMYYLEI